MSPQASCLSPVDAQVRFHSNTVFNPSCHKLSEQCLEQHSSLSDRDFKGHSWSKQNVSDFGQTASHCDDSVAESKQRESAMPAAPSQDILILKQTPPYDPVVEPSRWGSDKSPTGLNWTVWCWTVLSTSEKGQDKHRSHQSGARESRALPKLHVPNAPRNSWKGALTSILTLLGHVLGRSWFTRVPYRGFHVGTVGVTKVDVDVKISLSTSILIWNPMRYSKTKPSPVDSGRQQSRRQTFDAGHQYENCSRHV